MRDSTGVVPEREKECIVCDCDFALLVCWGCVLRPWLCVGSLGMVLYRCGFLRRVPRCSWSVLQPEREGVGSCYVLVRLSAAWARRMEGGRSSLAKPSARLSREAGALLSVFVRRLRLVSVCCVHEPGVYRLGRRGVEWLAWLGVPGVL